MNPRRLAKILLWIVLFDLIVGAFVYIGYSRYREHRYDALILEISQKYGVDPCLAKAVIWRESRFEPNKVGHSGEIGLMQVMPSTGADWARTVGRGHFSGSDLFDPRTNIEAGVWYLERGLEYWKNCDDPMPFAVAEYNAGRGNARKWFQPGFEHDAPAFVEAIQISSTKHYVQEVSDRYAHYKESGEFQRTGTP